MALVFAMPLMASAAGTLDSFPPSALDRGVDRLRGEQLVVTVDKASIPADGQSVARLTLEVKDASGNVVKRDLRVTVQSNFGRIVSAETESPFGKNGFAEELNSREPGTQVLLKEGKGEIMLAASGSPGEAVVRVFSGGQKVDVTVRFVPELRPLIATGLIDGIVRFSREQFAAQAQPRLDDGMEDELRQIGIHRGSDGTLQASGRGAAFVKGAVGQSKQTLLTMAVDTERGRTRFFRDIQPDQFYPIYGDASLRGFDAQSTRRNYLRVDRNRSYLLFGDFTTEDQSDEARSLGAYSRSLTGGRQHFESGSLLFDVYAARDSLRRVVEEQPGRGISGPYVVANGTGVENSEQVELVVRDRNQPALILDVQPMARFTDYEFEPFSGNLLFRRPVPTVDANLNPVSVRVTYEVDGGGPSFWVGGARALWRVGSVLEFGASAARDDDPLTPYDLTGASAKLNLGDHTTWVFEGARSDRDATLSQSALRGDGLRSEFRHNGERLDARLYWGKTDSSFDNPTALLSRGRRELGGKAQWRITEATDVTVDAIQTSDALVGADRTGASVLLGHNFRGERFRADVGLRYGHDEVNPAAAPGALPSYTSIYNLNPPGSLTGGAFSNGAFANGALSNNEFTTARARLTARLNKRSTAYVEGEHGLGQGDSAETPWAVTLGADYLVHEHTRLYARHERAQSLAGLYGLGTGEQHEATLVGLDTNYMRDGQLFTEYRMRDAINGRDAEAALGLRNLWRVAKGVAFSTNLERLEALDGSARKSTAAGVGLELTGSERYKASARLEWRDDAAAESWLSTLAWTAKLARDWSLLARNIYSRTLNDDVALGKRTQDRAIIGLAYRDTDTNIWNSLMRYEYKTERDTAALNPLDRKVHVTSFHANYKPVRYLTLSGQLAAKWVSEILGDSLGTVQDSFRAQLVSTRVLYDITERWDAGVSGSLLRAGTGARQYGLGLEVGRVLMDNLWLSAGYNLVGFSDRDLIDTDYTRRGFYLRLRYKFDEKLFGGRDPQINKLVQP
jgi:hypothetical protein